MRKEVIENKIFFFSILFIAITEFFSFLAFLFPSIMTFAFFLVLLFFFIISFKNISLALWIMVAELIIGSKGGYLFFLNIDGGKVSIRIAFWLVIMSIFLSRLLFFDKRKLKTRLREFVSLPGIKILFILLAFFVWGFINALFHNNNFSNIFFDLNGWLYFALLLPFLLLEKSDENNSSKQKNLLQVLLAAIFWISLKTMFLLFSFSHNLSLINIPLYSWLRKSGVAELTKMPGGFYRIFFQSHLFVLIFFVIALMFLLFELKNNPFSIKILKEKKPIFLILFLLSLSSTIIISMSRSNWVGLLSALVLVLLFYIWRYNKKTAQNFLFLTIIFFVCGYLLTLAIVSFPYPHPSGGFNPSSVLAKRAISVNGEAGASSRWNLLPELFKEIKKSPIMGSGFGTTVSYISDDPRVRQKNSDGSYTTFAFEWGWLDIWLKIGLFGMLTYLYFIFAIIKQSLAQFTSAEVNEYEIIKIGFSIGLISLVSVNFFSPYLNHPLGIAYIIFSIYLLRPDKEILSSPKENVSP